MNLRTYQSGDDIALATLFSDTIRASNAADYSSQQVEVWANDTPHFEAWLDRVDDRIIFIAEQDSEVAGFASFDPSGHIDHLYVHHRFQRQGVASALLQRIEKEAKTCGIGRLFTEASVTARPFFEAMGFEVIAPQNVLLKGISFLNYRMEKLLD